MTNKRLYQQIIDMATMMTGDEYTPVKEFYRDRSIFITGGTGFMGKVLVEKLLRSCPGIKNIYLLMRPKRGQDVQQRLQELLNAPVMTPTSLLHSAFPLFSPAISKNKNTYCFSFDSCLRNYNGTLLASFPRSYRWLVT